MICIKPQKHCKVAGWKSPRGKCKEKEKRNRRKREKRKGWRK